MREREVDVHVMELGGSRMEGIEKEKRKDRRRGKKISEKTERPGRIKEEEKGKEKEEGREGASPGPPDQKLASLRTAVYEFEKRNSLIKYASNVHINIHAVAIAYRLMHPQRKILEMPRNRTDYTEHSTTTSQIKPKIHEKIA